MQLLGAFLPANGRVPATAMAPGEVAPASVCAVARFGHHVSTSGREVSRIPEATVSTPDRPSRRRRSDDTVVREPTSNALGFDRAIPFLRNAYGRRRCSLDPRFLHQRLGEGDGLSWILVPRETAVWRFLRRIGGECGRCVDDRIPESFAGTIRCDALHVGSEFSVRRLQGTACSRTTDRR